MTIYVILVRHLLHGKVVATMEVEVMSEMIYCLVIMFEYASCQLMFCWLTFCYLFIFLILKTFQLRNDLLILISLQLVI